MDEKKKTHPPHGRKEEITQTQNAFDTCMALKFGIGCNNLFETTFEKEVYSDLTG